MRDPRLSVTSACGRLAFLCVAVAVALAAGGAGMARAAGPGSPNASFGSAGTAASASATQLSGTAVQSNGDVVAVGESGVGANADVLLERFTPSGAKDTSFGSGGVVEGPAITTAVGTGSLARAVAIQPDGKIVVVGTATGSNGSGTEGLLIERYDANGTLDTTFGTGGVVKMFSSSFGDGYAVAVQPNGDIVATGASDLGGVPYATVVRLTPSGSPDTSFGSGGTDVLSLGAYSYALAVALQSNGDIVIAGSQSPGLQVTNALVARLTPSGAVDLTFAGTGAVAHQYAPSGGAFSSFQGVAALSNGEIVADGEASAGNESAYAFIVRFTAAGAQDSSFGQGGVAYVLSAENWLENNGVVPGASGLTIAGNGDAIAAGRFVNSLDSNGVLWAFTPAGKLDSTFGTGGIAELSASYTEFAGATLSPTTGDVIAAGTTEPIGGADSGIVADFVAYGPPKITTPPLTLTVSGVSASYKTKTVTKSGLKFTAACNEACTINAALGASAGTAKKLHLQTTVKKCKKVHGKEKCTKVKVYRALTFSPEKGTLTKAGSKTFTLHLSKSLAKALAKQKSISLTLTVKAASTATHKTKTVTKTVRFTT
jgi:uncharacterized delta-60 repeat protein